MPVPFAILTAALTTTVHTPTAEGWHQDAREVVDDRLVYALALERAEVAASEAKKQIQIAKTQNAKKKADEIAENLRNAETTLAAHVAKVKKLQQQIAVLKIVPVEMRPHGAKACGAVAEPKGIPSRSI